LLEQPAPIPSYLASKSAVAKSPIDIQMLLPTLFALLPAEDAPSVHVLAIEQFAVLKTHSSYDAEQAAS